MLINKIINNETREVIIKYEIIKKKTFNQENIVKTIIIINHEHYLSHNTVNFS